MAEQGLIGFTVRKGTKKKDYSVTKWFENRHARFIELHLRKVLADTAEDIEGGQSEFPASDVHSNPEWEQLDCIDSEDDDLPF